MRVQKTTTDALSEMDTSYWLCVHRIQDYKRGVEGLYEGTREAAEDASRWSADAGGQMKSEVEEALEGACVYALASL